MVTFLSLIPRSLCWISYSLPLIYIVILCSFFARCCSISQVSILSWEIGWTCFSVATYLYGIYWSSASPLLDNLEKRYFSNIYHQTHRKLMQNIPADDMASSTKIFSKIVKRCRSFCGLESRRRQLEIVSNFSKTHLIYWWLTVPTIWLQSQHCSLSWILRGRVSAFYMSLIPVSLPTLHHETLR